MKSLTLLLSILLLPLSAWALREVEFEWEEVDGAKHYQVEIKNDKDFLQKLTSNTFTFKTQITPGKYQIRGKVHGIDPRDAQSDWSPWKAFDVPPAPVKTMKFENFEYKISSHSWVSEIPLKWHSVDGAAEYTVEIVDVNRKTKKTITVNNPGVLLKLRPGYFSVSITTKTADGLNSETFSLPQQIMVQNIPVEPPQKAVLAMDKGLMSFESTKGTLVIVALERQAFLGKDWVKIDEKTVTENRYQWPASLKPGKYRLTLFSKNSFDEVSTPVIRDFVIKPKESDLPQ